MRLQRKLCFATALLAAFTITTSSHAQRGPQGPRVVSPELKDGKVTFRILAPKAETVTLSGSDIPGMGRGKEMIKNADGVWEVTLDIAPGYLATISTLTV